LTLGKRQTKRQIMFLVEMLESSSKHYNQFSAWAAHDAQPSR